jgi:hypothetical protein
LIQYLFPSPDGVVLTYNSRNADPIGRLAQKKRFDVLNRLIMIAILGAKNRSLTQQELEDAILDTLIPVLDIPSYEKLKQTALKILTSVTGPNASERNLLVENLQIKNLDANKQALSLMKLIPFFHQMIDEEKSSEDLTLTTGYELSNTLKKSLKSFWRNEAIEVRILSDFTKILAQAIIQGRKPGIYPQHSVIYSLMAFAWKIADDVKELEPLTEVLAPSKDLKAQPFLEKDYDQGIETFIQLMNKDPEKVPFEEIVLYTQGFDAYKRLIPPLIPYNSTPGYPDCGETSLRNLFYILLGDRGVVTPEHLKAFLEKLEAKLKEINTFKLTYEFTHNSQEEHKSNDPIPSGPIEFKSNYPLLVPFIQYFLDYPSISHARTAKAHQAWSDVVANLNKRATASNLTMDTIQYRETKDTIGECNLPGDGGIQNMFRVITALFKVKIQTFEDVLPLFHRANHIIECECSEDQLKQSTNITLDFDFNGKRAFQWEITKNHFVIKSKERNDQDPSARITKETFLKIQDPWVQTLALPTSWPQVSPPLLQPFHLWRFDYGDAEELLPAVDWILYQGELKNEKDWKALYPSLIRNGLAKRVVWTDENAQNRIKTLLSCDPYRPVLESFIPKDITLKGNLDLKQSLFDSCKYGYCGFITHILDKNPLWIEARSSYGVSTPLHYAAYHGQTGVVKILLDKGAKIEDQGKYRYTPLNWAARKGHTEVVKILLEHKAKVEQKDIDVAKNIELKKLLQNAYDAQPK